MIIFGIVYLIGMVYTMQRAHKEIGPFNLLQWVVMSITWPVYWLLIVEI